LERSILFTIGEVHRRSEVADSGAGRGLRVPDADQGVRVWIGERPDQDAVEHAEDRGVRTDAQREREENGGRKRGSPSQAA
jgi:hypothetical protein